MKTFQLLTESSLDIEFLTEEVGGKKQLFIEGIFAQAEKKNGNGRIYPRKVMESALDRYINEYVSKNRAVGEIKHPEYPFPDPENASHRIIELRWDGNDVYGKALVLDTPKGQTVKGLIEGGYQWGISTRGLGTLKERNGYKEVQDDYLMTAHDLVDNPSGPDCYVNKLIESTRWSLNESTGVWIPVIDERENNKINEQLFLEKLERFIKGQRK